MRAFLVLFFLFSCDANIETTSDRLLSEQTQTPKISATDLSTEELSARRSAERFLKALQERNLETLKETAVVQEAFRAFLPENLSKTKEIESDIANAAVESEDPRLRRISQAVFYGILPTTRVGTYQVIVKEPKGTLQVLETAPIGNKVLVIRIGSDEGNEGKFLLDSCSAFAAPFYIPKTFGTFSSFESCRAKLKTLTKGMTEKDPATRQMIKAYLSEQPFVKYQREKTGAIAKERFIKDENNESFSYGLKEGDTLQQQFILGLNAYCNCLPNENTKTSQK